MLGMTDHERIKTHLCQQVTLNFLKSHGANNYSPENERMDTQNDGLEKVTLFQNGNFWYLC